VVPKLLPGEWDGAPSGGASPLYRSPLTDGTGQSICRIFGLADVHDAQVAHFPGVALFEVADETIVCRLEPQGSRLEADLLAAGPVLAFWHERAGRPVLHGACLAPAEPSAPAFALLGVKEAGKSTLAAALLTAGCSLLGDDLLPLEVARAPGTPPRALAIAPRIRLWPETIEHLLGPGAVDRFEPVHPSTTKRWVPVGAEAGEDLGRFDDRPRPLGVVYLPERRGAVDRPTFETLAPGQAVIELVRHSFLARMVEALGWQPRRLGLLARVAETVPVRRLVYPDGWERLDDTVEALLGDLRSAGNLSPPR
jgi:hypothetical protein